MASFGAQLFWMIALGLTLGYFSHYIYLKYSVPIWLSLALSTAGAVLMGVLAHLLVFGLPLMYALLGSVIFLFVGNLFLSQEE
ncbi:hypothetical protein [Fodinibius salsisoli]|uniref:Uncharacterized protein n=1 Tax=Fodinibius salsisoli TaxID=2820877 RepID=A0ABT3PMA6_9BACT|nr:hypothetical protein [Fodinibius salsisoli]MCW9706853.1 hypothetical protein [Fodinibius salsisoli]